MEEYLQLMLDSLGMPLWLLIIMLIWTSVWKMIAAWKAARKGEMVWFLAFFLFNTVGILEILYVFVFSKLNLNKGKKKKQVAKKKRR